MRTPTYTACTNAASMNQRYFRSFLSLCCGCICHSKIRMQMKCIGNQESWISCQVYIRASLWVHVLYSRCETSSAAQFRAHCCSIVVRCTKIATWEDISIMFVCDNRAGTFVQKSSCMVNIDIWKYFYVDLVQSSRTDFFAFKNQQFKTFFAKTW